MQLRESRTSCIYSFEGGPGEAQSRALAGRQKLVAGLQGPAGISHTSGRRAVAMSLKRSQESNQKDTPMLGAWVRDAAKGGSQAETGRRSRLETERPEHSVGGLVKSAGRVSQTQMPTRPKQVV